MKKIFRIVPYLLVAILVGVTITYAGNLTPPGPAENTMYTLTNLYNLASGATATLGSGDIPSTPGTVEATGKTLTEVYVALAAEVAKLSAGVIASGTNPFGITGTGIISLGDAVAGNVLAGKYFSNATTANVLGTMADKTGLSVASTAQSQAGGVNYFTATQGYYDGTAKVSATDAQVAALDADIATGNILTGTTIFGVTGSATAGYTYSTGPRTGQTICYDASGSGNVVACAGTGQDGELLKGVARSYTDNSDGTITDNVTGLIWQKCSKGLSGTTCATGSAETTTWANALSYCNANTAALPGSNWRLPNIYELYSLVDFGVASAPFIDGTYFPATVSGNYWSSTSRPAIPANTVYVSFSSIAVAGGSKQTSYYVRCVRG